LSILGNRAKLATVVPIPPFGKPAALLLAPPKGFARRIDPDIHLDEDGERTAQPGPTQPSRSGRLIDITLRSTPPGAQVAVDGRVLGNTPAYWNGTADGREHEFVFTMRGYAIARYRFVPISSGVIHGRLEPTQQETDAGVLAPPPEVVPPQPLATPSANPPSAPPTIVPDAAAPVAPAPPAGTADSSVGPAPRDRSHGGGRRSVRRLSRVDQSTSSAAMPPKAREFPRRAAWRDRSRVKDDISTLDRWMPLSGVHHGERESRRDLGWRG
jgi:hypothetical protein